MITKLNNRTRKGVNNVNQITGGPEQNVRMGGNTVSPVNRLVNLDMKLNNRNINVTATINVGPVNYHNTIICST